MTLKNRWKLFTACSLLIAAACQEPDTSSPHWGHLNSSSLVPDAPQYLINHRPGETYRVCVPKYMLDELPGLRSEIDAAVNIWARYIGRQIPVEIVTQNLPRSSNLSSLDQMRTQYYQMCGSNFHVVLALAPLPGTAVGQTGSTWRINHNGVITSFQRHVVLRDYHTAPDPYGRVRSWISFEELTGQRYSANQLLSIMERRGRIEVDPNGRSLTLPVLVHEFGHVWGLCDQYEGPNNCDPRYSSQHPVLNSIMGSSSSINKIYLTDDDIKGIRELARRPGFSPHWPGSMSSLSLPPQPIVGSEVQYFELKGRSRQGGAYNINFGLVTRSQGGELRIQYRRPNMLTWQNAGTFFPSQGPFRISDHTIRIPLPDDNIDYQFRLMLNLRGSDQNLSSPIYRY